MIPAYNASDPYELLIAQMIRLEAQPQVRLQQQRNDREVQRAVLDDFDSSLSALHTTLEGLTDPLANPFLARAATVPEGAGFGATVTDEAAIGSHTVAVERLATTDARVSRRLDADGGTLASFFSDNGVQTFSIEVASPTDDDPDRRVSVAVAVQPVGSTDSGILGEIRTAISDAMADAVDAGEISATEAVAASVVTETSDTARLSLRSAGTGYDNRLALTDSDDGLLSLLQLDRTELASTAGTVTTPATAASVTGDAVEVPLTLGILDGRSLDITVDGTATTVEIPTGTYDTVEDLAAALGDELGSDVTVDVEGGALRIATAATGSAASIQITGGSALDALGLEAMASPATGTDETTTTVSADESGGALVEIGTGEADSGLNARFVLDGLTMIRSSNEVDDALDGVTLSLNSVGEATTFNVETDAEAVAGEVEDFIGKYNAVLDFIEQRSKVDPESGSRGQFVGDSSIQGLRFGMRTDLLTTVEGQPEGIERLTDLGIEIGDDGRLTLADRDALVSAAAADPGALQNLFANADDGLATKLQGRLDVFLGVDGTLDARRDIADDRIRRLDRSIESWDGRLAQREESLRQQFAELQETLALLQGQQATLSNMFFTYGYGP